MWDWVTQAVAGPEGPRHLRRRRGRHHRRTRPEWTVADLGLAGARRGRPARSIPQSEPGQAAFVINNVRAKAVFVENAQQAAKIASIRAECPTLEHVITLDPSGKFPEGTLTLEDVIARADHRCRRPPARGARASTGSAATTSPPSSTPRARPATRRARCSATATCSSTTRPPTRSSTSTRPMSSSPSCRSSHIYGRIVGRGRGAGAGRGGRVRRGAARAAAGQHGRGQADGDGRPSRASTSASTPGSSRRSRRARR